MHFDGQNWDEFMSSLELIVASQLSFQFGQTGLVSLLMLR